MKKMMWFFAILPVLVTSIVLPLMPDTIPMHHDLAGNIDRWGSKTECFVFPVIILFITLFWHLLMRAFEKKAAKGKSGIISYYEIKGKLKVEYVWHTPKILLVYYNLILYIRYLIRKMKGEI